MQQFNDPYICRVCAYKAARPFYKANGSPEYEICQCCGSESGYYDVTPQAVESNRRVWIQKGALWMNLKLKPADWNLEEQLQSIGVNLKDYQEQIEK